MPSKARNPPSVQRMSNIEDCSFRLNRTSGRRHFVAFLSALGKQFLHSDIKPESMDKANWNPCEPVAESNHGETWHRHAA